jgi:hypothetical protein
MADKHQFAATRSKPLRLPQCGRAHRMEECQCTSMSGPAQGQALGIKILCVGGAALCNGGNVGDRRESFDRFTDITAGLLASESSP